MTTQANNKSKTTSFNLSSQVKRILHTKGLSKAFNYTEYQYFKSQCKNAFNKAQEIANKFIEEYQEESEFNEYIF